MDLAILIPCCSKPLGRKEPEVVLEAECYQLARLTIHIALGLEPNS